MSKFSAKDPISWAYVVTAVIAIVFCYTSLKSSASNSLTTEQNAQEYEAALRQDSKKFSDGSLQIQENIDCLHGDNVSSCEGVISLLYANGDLIKKDKEKAKYWHDRSQAQHELDLSARAAASRVRQTPAPAPDPAQQARSKCDQARRSAALSYCLWITWHNFDESDEFSAPLSPSTALTLESCGNAEGDTFAAQMVGAHASEAVHSGQLGYIQRTSCSEQVH